MQRIDDPTAATALPTPEAAGTPGYFTEGSPTAGTPATNVRGSWLNMVQEELMAIVAAAGISPSKTVYTQVLAAIRAMTADGARIQGLVGNNNAATPTTQFDFSALAVTVRNPTSGATAVITNTGVITNNLLFANAGPVANGRDQSAAFSASRWIYFYFIWNPTTSTLATISSTATPAVGPALPPGFTAWAYIGTLYYSSSSSLAVGYFRGSWFAYTSPIAVVTSGSATSPAPISIPTIVPPTAHSPMFELQVLNLGINATAGGAYSGTMTVTIDNIGQSLISGLQGGGAANTFTAISGAVKRLPNLSQGFTYQWGNLGSSTSPQVNISCGGYSVANGGE